MRTSLIAAAAAVPALALCLLTPPSASAQESRVRASEDETTLQYRLEEDERNPPVLRRSLFLDDPSLRALELDVIDHERRRRERDLRRRIFFEDIERLDDSPFLK